MKKPIIFPHIPKCGGTSILKGLKYSGKKVFLDYDHPPSHITYFSGLCKNRNADFQILDFSPFDVVYGHFPIERYNVPNDQVILLLRDPVERALSHYYYFKDIIPLTNKMALARVPEIADIKSGKLRLFEFAQKLHLAHYYQNYVGRIDTRFFRLVGFTDEVGLFAERLRNEVGIDLGPLGRERANPTKPSTDDLADIKQLLREESEWYCAQRMFWR